MSSLKIEVLKSSLSIEVIEVLARAYLTNPIHIAIFGGSGDQELQLGRNLFIAMNQFICTGQWYAAISENQILGCFHMSRFPSCRASKEQLKEVGARLVKTLGEFSTRVAIWGSDWGKRDPEKDHWHFGPIGVLPEHQKKGIGRLMMEHFCAIVDKTGTIAYLETDRPENVGFYEKSGFAVIDKGVVLETPCWFMTRDVGRM